MRLEDMVLSLELAIELKEHGYPQETAFYWVKRNETWIVVPSELISGHELFPTIYEIQQGLAVAAPTASEIGEQLPRYLTIANERYPYWFSQKKDGEEEGWLIWYGNRNGRTLEYTLDKNEANARANMWLYLKKNNLLGGTQ